MQNEAAPPAPYHQTEDIQEAELHFEEQSGGVAGSDAETEDSSACQPLETADEVQTMVFV